MTIRNESGLTRRTLLTGGAFAGLLAAGALGRAWQQLQRLKYDPETELPSTAPAAVARVGAMPYRRFGATGLQASEFGFGAWATGGEASGAVCVEDWLR